MTLLNKDNAKLIQRKSKTVSFEEYDLEVKLMALTLSQQLEVEETNKDNQSAFVLSMIQYSCVDENNAPLFDSVDDVANLPADLTIKIFKECLQLNHLVENDLEKLAKNS